MQCLARSGPCAQFCTTQKANRLDIYGFDDLLSYNVTNEWVVWVLLNVKLLSRYLYIIFCCAVYFIQNIVVFVCLHYSTVIYVVGFSSYSPVATQLSCSRYHSSCMYSVFWLLVLTFCVDSLVGGVSNAHFQIFHRLSVVLLLCSVAARHTFLNYFFLG